MTACCGAALRCELVASVCRMVLMLARQAACPRALCAAARRSHLASMRALSLSRDSLFAFSSVVRVQDAAEPYTVEIAIQLRGAPEEGEARARMRTAR